MAENNNQDANQPKPAFVPIQLSATDQTKFDRLTKLTEVTGKLPKRETYQEEKDQWDRSGRLIGDRKHEMRRQHEEIRGRNNVEPVDESNFNQQTLSPTEGFATVEEKDAFVAAQGDPDKQNELLKVVDLSAPASATETQANQQIEAAKTEEAKTGASTAELDATNPNPKTGEIADQAAYKAALESGALVELPNEIPGVETPGPIETTSTAETAVETTDATTDVDASKRKK